MSATISPIRRLAVTIAMAGVAAIGTVALAPAALADDAVVVESAPATEAAPVVEAPVVEAPPQIVFDKDGKPVKAPKVCTTKDLEKVAEKVAKAGEKNCLVLAPGGIRF